jgi:segregation and condensation protein A
MSEYRVNLDVYNGPLDLLLYLIRRDELDICDIPIAAVTEQYLKHMEVLHQIDPNLAGEFLVLAATLMEIKTRMLLPAQVAEDGLEQTSALDPRAELVRQLLEYKAFKDASGDLATAAEIQAMKFPRHPANQAVGEGEMDLEDVQVWDLLDAFSKLMASIGKQKSQHEVIYDDTPVELHAEDIMDRLGREGPMSFAKIFEGRTARGEIVGLFLALLELVRQKRAFAVQDANFGEIKIQINPDPPRQDSAGHVAHFADDDSTSLPGDAAPEGGGQYVSDMPAGQSLPQAQADQDQDEDEDDFASPVVGDGSPDASTVALEENDSPAEGLADDDEEVEDEDQDDDFDDEDDDDDEEDEDDEDDDSEDDDKEGLGDKQE